MSTTFARCRLRRPRVGRFVQRIARRGPRARSSTPLVATGCGARSRRFLLRRSGVAKIDPVREGVVTFTRWTHGWTPCHPVSVRCPGFLGSSLAALLVPTFFVRCKLPVVCLSTRLAWPSPCSLTLGWGLGSQRVLLGECGRSGVPRGWSSSLLECQSS